MKKTISILLIFVLSCMLTSAVFAATGDTKPQQKRSTIKQYQDSMKKQSVTFRDSLKNKSPEERRKAVDVYRKNITEKQRTFRDALHKENMVVLKAKLAANKKMNNSEKDDLCNFYEKQYMGLVDFSDVSNKASVAEFQKISNTAKLSNSDMKKSMKKYVDAQNLQTMKKMNAERAKNAPVRPTKAK